MVKPENRLSQSDSELATQEQRLRALSELGLLESQTVPVFEEATQTAARSLNAPICILGFLDREYHWFKSAVGLSRLGLMNRIAATRSLPRHESFCTHVVERQQVLAISDTLADPAFAQSLLAQPPYGIRAYLGVPLMDFSGHCLGAIAVMDLETRTFTRRDIEFLELMARWSMSEFERNRLLQAQTAEVHSPPLSLIRKGDSDTISPAYLPKTLFINQVKLELLGKVAHELRTPLTSVLGMAGVLSREIYGPLMSKQKEYLEIIQHSGRYLHSLVNEISELGTPDASALKLNLTSVDVEMLCQQAINTLEEAANRRDQEIRLSMEPGRRRVLVLDKDKVRQLLHYLVFSVIQSTTTGSVIRIHISSQGNGLKLSVGVSHPWLGDGLTGIDPSFSRLLVPVVSDYLQGKLEAYPTPLEALGVKSGGPPAALAPCSIPLAVPAATDTTDDSASVLVAQPDKLNRSRESLSLILSCYLAELHGGQISIQGTLESGYRYLVNLPELVAEETDFDEH